MRANKTSIRLLILALAVAVPQFGSAARPTPKKSGAKIEKKYFSVNGELFHLAQRRNSRGVVTEQMVFSNNRIQLAFDQDGDGTWDSWESHTPERRVIYHDPRNGHFMRMDVEYVAGDSVVYLNFVRKNDGRYHLVWRSRGPKTLHLLGKAPEDIVVGCRQAESRLQREAAEINILLANSSPATKDQIIEKIFTDIVDNSCKTPEWMGTKADPNNPMLAAIFEVFNSDPDFRDATSISAPRYMEKVVNETTQPKYLACLRKYQLDTHAARISAALHTYIQSENPFRWKITCRDAVSSDPIGIRGEYRNWDGAPPHVTFIKDKRNRRDSGAYLDRTKEDFAMTFFHEMLHYALIQDEDVVHTIEDCCTQTNPNAKACQDLREYVNLRLTAQKYANAILKQLDPEIAVQLSDIIEDVYGSSSKEKFDNLVYHLALARKAALDSQACRNEGEYAEEKLTDPNSACHQEWKNELETLTSWMFSREQCSQMMIGKLNSAEDRRQYCAYLEEYAKQVILGIESKDLQEVCKAYASGYETGERRWLAWLWRPSVARAGVVSDENVGFMDRKKALCQVARLKLDWDQVNASEDYRPLESVVLNDQGRQGFDESRRVPLDEMVQGGAINAGNLYEDYKTVSPNSKQRRGADGAGGSGYSSYKRAPAREHISFVRERQGPPTFDYSEGPSERARKISESLKIETETDSRIKKYVEAAYHRVVPEAQAKQANKVTSVVDNTAKSFSVPDPFVAFNRAPASVSGGSGIKMASAGSGEQQAKVGSATKRGESKAGVTAKASEESSASASAANKGRGVAGLASKASAGRAAGATPSPSPSAQKTKEVDRRALNAFLKYMQNIDRRLMKVELKRPSVLKSLDQFRVAVVDDEGKRYGPVDIAEHWLVYSHEKGRLVLMKEGASR